MRRQIKLDGPPVWFPAWMGFCVLLGLGLVGFAVAATGRLVGFW